MDSFEKLVKLFEEFPGIGGRQARRFAYFLLSKQSSFIEELTSLAKEIKRDTAQCPLCMRFSSKKNDSTCSICIDENRDKNTLMIISKDTDLRSIEESGVYNGLYFVLGGLLPILEKDPNKKIRIDALRKRIEKNNLKEIILAFNATSEGENTILFLKENLKPFGIKISELGRGISTGTEIEYIDAETLKGALQNKHPA